MASIPRPLAVTSLCCAFLVTGCYVAHDRRSGPDVVLPDAAVLDAGRMSATDASRRPDAGLPRRDAGPRPRDAGLGCASRVGDYEGPGCEPSTGECLRDCADEISCNDCLASDPECIRCVNTTIISCSNDAGCGPLWVDFACCASTVPECVGLSGVDLLLCVSACEAQLAAYSECVNTGPATMCSEDLGARCGVF